MKFLYELKGQLTQNEKQKLREAPFTQQALVEDEAFEKAFKAACKIKRADVPFSPLEVSRHHQQAYSGQLPRLFQERKRTSFQGNCERQERLLRYHPKRAGYTAHT